MENIVNAEEAFSSSRNQLYKKLENAINKAKENYKTKTCGGLLPLDVVDSLQSKGYVVNDTKLFFGEVGSCISWSEIKNQ